MQYMRARLIAHSKEIREDGSIIEIVIWELPKPLHPSSHGFKYRLYYGCGGIDRVRYDNERGKGDHRHIDGMEQPYAFRSIDRLLDDFERDIAMWGAA